MANQNPIIALSSLALGAALLLVALQIQRDRLAFTSRMPRSSDAAAELSVVPITPPATPDPAALAEEGSVAFEALLPLHDKTLAPKVGKSPAAAESIQTDQPPCNPEWRELESGPAGKRVREIC